MNITEEDHLEFVECLQNLLNGNRSTFIEILEVIIEVGKHSAVASNFGVLCKICILRN